jgi:NADH dehydrogenase
MVVWDEYLQCDAALLKKERSYLADLHPNLVNGSKVAVIGGGPAGAFFALYLRQYAGEKGLYPDITIYEHRNFNELGSKGCKGCAGVLSIPFSENLDELGLTVPDGIIQSHISQYAVHSPYTSISISNPEKKTGVVSIYRGGGPRLSHYETQVSFNEWLLDQVRERDIKIKDQSVSSIHLEELPRLDINGERPAFDLIVLATGINARPITISNLNYVSPGYLVMSQEELYAGVERVESCLGKVAHVFLIPHSGMIFGTLVPKGPFINVSVLSKAKHPVPTAEFLKYDLVRHLLPEHYEHSCGCRPKVAIGLAKNFFADRFTAVGEAAVSRLYKDGIGSSLVTSREAARTVVYHGLSRGDFKRYYYPLCHSISTSNLWGKLLFNINDRAKNSRVFLLAQNRIIGNEQHNIKGPQPFTKAAWGMFSGSYSYDNIARMTLNPVSIAKLAYISVIEGLKLFFNNGVSQPRKLYVGNKKIVILGSGFGGTYVFRHLLPALNRNENVDTTMVSDENFFLFSPLLHEVAMGKIETRHIAFPIRRLHWRDRFNFIQARVEEIDLTARKVRTTSGTLDYDYLVLALGSVTDTSILKPEAENVFTIKTLNDSMLIRNHIIEIFERAGAENDQKKLRQLLTFVVCGAGYTGVQLVTELRDFVFGHLVKFYSSVDPKSVKIVLIEAEPKILAGLPVELSAYSFKELQHMGIELRLNSQVTEVSDSHVEVNNVECISTATIIWVAGIVANPCVAALNVDKDSLGRVVVNSYMEVPGAAGVYAAGDCAHFEDPVSGRIVPPRAHTAVRQARVVAHNILAEIRGWDKKEYHYSNNAEVVSLGASKAVFRFYNLRIYGFVARLLWIGGYSFLVTGIYNRIRIVTDWGLSFLFGRDTTFLKLKK